MLRSLAHTCLVCAFAFAGGYAAQYAAAVKPSLAAAEASLLEGSGLKRYYDSNGKLRLDLGIHNDNPIQDFYGEDGKLRMQMATYVAPGEKGLPFLSLSDNSGNIRLLFRLAGKNESPVIIFKDKQHRDRMVFGLGMNDDKEEPFLAYFDAYGQSHTAFGDY